MSLPYFPMYPTDFEAKTSHLTIAEDGAYNRLLRICWMTPGCTMPTDEAWIMRRVRAHTDEDKDTVRSVLSEFFTTSKGRYSNAKLMRIFLASNEAHEKRKSAGSKGGKAKALQSNNKAPSNAVAKPKQPEPEPEPYIIKRDTKVSPKKRAARLPDDWVLSKEWGDWALSEGYAFDVIKIEAEKFRDYWIGVGGQKGTKLDWLATWRNWMRNSKQGRSNGNGNYQQGNSPADDPTLQLIARVAGKI